MNKSEKFTMGAVLIALIASFGLYGVWEDKVWLFAPLLTLITIALAFWAISPKPEATSARHHTGERKTRLGALGIAL